LNEDRYESRGRFGRAPPITARTVPDDIESVRTLGLTIIMYFNKYI